jgi:hypothetical protein
MYRPVDFLMASSLGIILSRNPQVGDLTVVAPCSDGRPHCRITAQTTIASAVFSILHA